MNSESKINIHHSSLVGLKAELLKKQTEVEEAKAKLENSTQGSTKSKNKKFLEKEKKKKLKETKTKDDTEDIETSKTLKRSHLMLQAKSRLYEELSKSRININPNFLVDFEHKADGIFDNSSEEKQEKSDSESESEWIEYTDYFGRTRKCLREDLPNMEEQDKLLQQKTLARELDNKKKIKIEKEPEIETMRKKWEEQTAKLVEKVDIHYQDILFDEARTHGVGYYAFSQDEEERAKQQQNLLKLRKETEQKQKENEEIQKMKNKIQQNRLRVAKLRQRIRAGLSVEQNEENKVVDTSKIENKIEDKSKIANKESELTDKSKVENEEVEKHNNQEKTTKNKLEDIENKIQAFGELLGKRNQWYVMSQEEWVQKKRKERIEEFAPVYKNFEKGETLIVSYENDLDNNHSNIIGPLPPTLQEETDKGTCT